jgi:large subunit ribosomal protein L29
MPIMRLKEINDMSADQRMQKLSELRAELSRLRTMISAGGAVENPARVKALRKTIARILTAESRAKLNNIKPEETPKPIKSVKKKAKPKEKEKK